MEEFIKIMQELARDVRDLKTWQAKMTAQQLADEAEAERTQREFLNFIRERKEKETKRAADEAELRKMMV